jgi:hypothetical protein
METSYFILPSILLAIAAIIWASGYREKWKRRPETDTSTGLPLPFVQASFISLLERESLDGQLRSLRRVFLHMIEHWENKSPQKNFIALYEALPEGVKNVVE